MEQKIKSIGKIKFSFLEDEGEDGERLERYFNQLLEIIREQKQMPKAILLGNFLEANPHGTPQANNINIAIERMIAKIKARKWQIPILKEKSHRLGHCKNMRPLILGLNTDITYENKTSSSASRVVLTQVRDNQ